MEPRIVVPNTDDFATVVSALVEYSHIVSARAVRSGDVTTLIEEQKRIVGLLETLHNAVLDECAEKLFGPVPDDEDIQKAFEKFRTELGDDGSKF